MLKQLYKQVNNSWEYCEIWNEANVIVVQQGKLGKKGRVKKHVAPNASARNKQFAIVVREYKKAGFKPFPPESYSSVLIECSAQPIDDSLLLLLSESITANGNGYYDGNEVGSDGVTFYYNVIDPTLVSKKELTLFLKKQKIKNPNVKILPPV